MTEEMTYEPKRGLGTIDRVLLRGAAAGKSGKEISALTNGVISPAAAMSRVLEILDERDWLSIAQKKMLLIDDLMEMKDELRHRFIENKNLDAARTQLATLEAIMKMLNADKLDIGKAMSQIRHAHAQMMMGATRLALEAMLLELQRSHPEIDWQTEMSQAYLVAMPQAVKEIESHVGAD